MKTQEHTPHPKHPNVQAYICRLSNGKFGLVVWGGPHNGTVESRHHFAEAEKAALVCHASVVYCDV